MLSIYASARPNDFTGVDNYYDLWHRDKFQKPDEDQDIFVRSATESGTLNFIHPCSKF